MPPRFGRLTPPEANKNGEIKRSFLTISYTVCHAPAGAVNASMTESPA